MDYRILQGNELPATQYEPNVLKTSLIRQSGLSPIEWLCRLVILFTTSKGWRILLSLPFYHLRLSVKNSHC